VESSAAGRSTSASSASPSAFPPCAPRPSATCAGAEKALATAVQLLDRALLRVGGEEYAAAHRNFGLATFRSRHLTVEDLLIVLDFEGKGGADHHAGDRERAPGAGAPGDGRPARL
jgi:hypothetical protein